MLQILNKVRELITNHIFIYVTCRSFLEELTDRTETLPYSLFRYLPVWSM